MHKYTKDYDKFFSHLRDKPIRIFEIGTHKGNSIRMWNEYFNNVIKIVGLDIVDKDCECTCDCHNFNFNINEWTPMCKNLCQTKCKNNTTVKKCLEKTNANITCYIGSQADNNILKEIIEQNGPFDIIIDDGSHLTEHQKISFEYLFPTLNNNGIYVIEDLHTSYSTSGPYRGGGLKQSHTAVEFLKDLIDDININGKFSTKKQAELSNREYLNYYENNISGIYNAKSICFIFKERL